MDKLFAIFLALFITACAARNAFPDMTDTDFQTECNYTSNAYRKNHSSPAFVVDPKLVDYAKSRCNVISQSEGLSAGHDGNTAGYGENLFWGGAEEYYVIPCGMAIDYWYDESSLYDYGKPGYSESTGHFTQLVWKNSGAVGCARCFDKGSQYYETYVVCNFKAAGNVKDNFPANVTPH